MLPALGQAQTSGVSVPLMLAPDSERQGFVRIINGTGRNGSVRVTAVDDAGNAASPIEIELPAGASVHFNSDDLADGNAAKGIRGIGQPQQGHWRLRVEAAEGVQVMAFVRTRAGFLTAMHDVLPRNDQGRLVAWMLNPGSNRIQESSLRLVNTGTNSERVSISSLLKIQFSGAISYFAKKSAFDQFIRKRELSIGTPKHSAFRASPSLPRANSRPFSALFHVSVTTPLRPSRSSA